MWMIKCEKNKKQSSIDATEDSDKHSVKWRKFMSSTLQASVLMEKNYSDNWHSIKKQKISEWNRCSTFLRNWCPNKMRSMEGKQLTGKTLHGNTCLWLVMNKSSVSSALKSTYSQIHYCLLEKWARTLNQILHGKTDWRGSKFTRIQSFGQNWWWANGTRVEHFPKIHHFAAQPQTPRAVVMIERNTREFYKKDHLHVYVQRHLMRVKRQRENAQLVSLFAKRFGARQMVIPRI